MGIIIVAAIMTAVFAAAYLKCKEFRAHIVFCAQMPDTPERCSKRDIVNVSILLCNKAIVSSIESLLSSNASDSCRNNRILDFLHSGYEVFKKKTDVVTESGPVNNLWETGLRITQLSRDIATSQDYTLSDLEKSYIIKMRDDIAIMMDNLEYIPVYKDVDVIDEIDRAKEYVLDIIRGYSVTMSIDDYQDDGIKYKYLLLLHNIYAYFLTLKRIV